jgi:hypothetical protein
MSSFNWNALRGQYGLSSHPNPWSGSQWNPDFQAIADRATSEYNPRIHGDFGEYLARSGPTVQSQFTGSLLDDWQSLMSAEDMRLGMWGEGLNQFQGALQDYMPGIRDIMGDYGSTMEDIMADQDAALGEFMDYGQSAIDELAGEYDAILGAGAASSAEMREVAEGLRAQGEEYYQELLGRADEMTAGFEEREEEAQGRFEDWAGKVEGSLEQLVAGAQDAASQFNENGLAFLQSQKGGIDADLASKKDALAMSDLPPEQQAVLSAQMDREGSAAYAATAAASANQFSTTQFQVNMGVVNALGMQAQGLQGIASAQAQLDTAMVGAFNQISAISGDLAAKGAQIGSTLDIEAGKVQTQAAMVDFQSQLEASNLMKEVTNFKFALNDRRAQWEQFIGGMGAQAAQFTASTLANASGVELQGYGQLAEYYQTFEYNPASRADVMLASTRFGLMGREAGIDFSATRGTRYGNMAQGGSGNQYWHARRPGGSSMSSWEQSLQWHG